jgi:hypothetical protein
VDAYVKNIASIWVASTVKVNYYLLPYNINWSKIRKEKVVKHGRIIKCSKRKRKRTQ